MESSLYIQTPLIKSDCLSQCLAKEVYLKLECLQPSASFKNRGIGTLCDQLKKDGAKCFVASSGGNAGLAVAYSGRALQVPVKVVVPESTPEFARDKIRREGAELIVHGKHWNECDLVAQEIAKTEQGAYVPPFDHPLIWKGNATLIHETAKAGLKPDAVILAVAGGGLFCGAAEGLHDLGWDDTAIVASETEGAASFYQSIKKGSLVTLDRIETIATSLSAARVSEKALEWSKKRAVFPQIVTDKEAVDACLKFADDHRILVEPACGAALALLYQKREILQSYKKILVVICGGAGVSLNLLKLWSQK